MNNSLLIFILLNITLSNVQAEKIVGRMPSGFEAFAEFSQGETGKPAILLLHGFMQTHEFITVNGLQQNLFDEGYTVLSPTLALGINRRAKSLECEALHLHSMDDDINDIQFWINWLKQRGNKKIIIVGHSYGSTHALAYISSDKLDNTVKAAIATSMVNVENSFSSYANALKANINDGLVEYRFVYCEKFVAPKEIFLSYTYWDRENILLNLAQSKIPISLIMGGKDKQSSKQWLSELKATGSRVILVKNANHFFDREEFELFDQVIGLVDNL